jgi:putative NIF3 family GTP cyclohydrolase 1 type 2
VLGKGFPAGGCILRGMTRLPSRRHFLAAGSALLGATRLSGQTASANLLPAATIVERIKAHVGIPWRTQTVDRIVAGRPETPIRGVASVMMATFEMIRRAQAAGLNMVVTHESTFFSHLDDTRLLVDDPTYLVKRAFIDEHGIVIFHLHDHWHGLQPIDGIAAGMTRELGWERNVDPGNFRQFTFDGVPLARFAQDMRAKLGIRVMRVIGDPSLPIRRAAASWGNCSLFPGVAYLNAAQVDVLIVGETLEWELVEYVQDTISRGQAKALIILGHVMSEQGGMKYFADWLRPIVPEVDVRFLPAPEPYWSPDAPTAG